MGNPFLTQDKLTHNTILFKKIYFFQIKNTLLTIVLFKFSLKSINSENRTKTKFGALNQIKTPVLFTRMDFSAITQVTIRLK